MARQRSIFKELLSIVRDEPVLLSIHSSGVATEVVEHLHDADMRGAILHWFNGDATDVARALEADAYFSVNAAMSEDQIRLLPLKGSCARRTFLLARSALVNPPTYNESNSA